ncbi:LOW QUALITY PROTEIN: alkane hydroxylase MAH1-like [Phalaenopsis equestris]|uniref:LOW QUALITY PROTEIN: alkane hydroxylase MAH1-like n=1 Tax=Phalaenopsis equestris TaxID=78828 RepID=UPI0009E47724|nr:LOW QUALITY PROTEIN: alkane hydroxylase MAH1-like [Phalaenopsis equestris]
MDAELPLQTVLLLSTILCLLFLLFLHKRRTGPGALTNWPIVGMLPGLTVNLHRLHDFLTDLLGPSGCTFLFRGPWFSGMKLLFTCDPANANHIFNVNFHNYPKGHKYSENFDILGEGIFNADDESWSSQRKKAHILIAQPRFRAFVTSPAETKLTTFSFLCCGNSEQKKIIDLQDVFLRLTFDVTCRLVFGIDPASLSPDFHVEPFAKGSDDAMATILHRHVVPPLWWKLMRRLKLGREKKLAEAWVVAGGVIAASIQKRKKESNRSDSLNDSLLTAYIKDDSLAGDKFLRDTTLSFMIAGRDTIGVALAWFFYLLCKNPDKEAKLVEEIRRGEATVGEEMVYLQAALCEALRLYPPVPFEEKGAVEAEMLPSGQRVEPGMQVLFSTYTMGRMPGVWGKDCLEFRPERWITEKGKMRHEPSYKFMPFNCGPRACLGKATAFAVLREVVVAVVREFRLEMVEGQVVEPKLSIILHMRNGFKVRVMRRHS